METFWKQNKMPNDNEIKKLIIIIIQIYIQIISKKLIIVIIQIYIQITIKNETTRNFVQII
jgi:hypothetical protein